jgi:hypothetical protein
MRSDSIAGDNPAIPPASKANRAVSATTGPSGPNASCNGKSVNSCATRFGRLHAPTMLTRPRTAAENHGSVTN